MGKNADRIGLSGSGMPMIGFLGSAVDVSLAG
jgi:hypothetical protein